MPKAEIRSFTGLRGVAACWVVLFHMNEEAGLSGLGGNMVKHGYLAVDVFFVLSGFVMAMSYRTLFEPGFSQRAYATFLLRRFARVWPLYGLTTLAYAALLGAGLGSGRVKPSMLAGLLPLNLSMIQAWGFGNSIIRPAWSISTEFAAYLLFPLFAWAFLFSRSAITVVASGLAFLILCSLPTLSGHSGRNGPLDLSEAGTVWPLVRCLVDFPLGLAAFRVAAQLKATLIIFKSFAVWSVAILLLGLTTVPNTDVVIVAIIPLFLIQLAKAADTGVTLLLGSAPVHFVGIISYAIYLIHWVLVPVLRFSPVFQGVLSPFAAGMTMQLVLYAVLALVSTAAYYVVEMPARKWVNQLVERIYPRQVGAVEASEDIGERQLR